MRLQPGRKLVLGTVHPVFGDGCLEFFAGAANITEYTVLPSGVLELTVYDRELTKLLTRQFFYPQFLLRVEEVEA